jgi:blue copper oxidase
MKREPRRLSRRSALALGAVLLVPKPLLAAGSDAGVGLPIPRLMDASSGPIELEARKSAHAFHPERPAEALGYSSSYLGPTLRFRRGGKYRLSVRNGMDRPTSTHLHGLLIPAEADGGPHRPISPGETWASEFLIDQPATTAWYHAHPHGDTGRQVYFGLAGMAIVDDADGPVGRLPSRYGVDDLPLVIQDRIFDPLGRPLYMANMHTTMMGMRGNTFIVNGAIDPVARVPAGLVRLRILNGANARNFDIGFDDQRTFHVVGSDGGLLPAPMARRDLVIGPGERYEIVVDFTDGRPAALETASDTAAILAGRAPAVSRTMGRGSGRLLRFEVDAGLAAHPTPLPASLSSMAPTNVTGNPMRRIVSLDMGPSMMGQGAAMGSMQHGPGGMFGINGRPYDPERVDFEVPLGSTEIWEVRPNLMTHPFHIHGATFRILSIGGEPPSAHLAGDKDTLLADRPVELLVSFRQPATRQSPFMFHCHVLEHEDAGMMAQFVTI